MERREGIDLVVAAVVLVAVFAYEGFSPSAFVANIPAAAIGVAAGFLLHELAHRFFAHRYKLRAEFRLWKGGLLLAVLFSLVSGGRFVFAAPGAVVIGERADLWGNVRQITREKFGIIAIAGPAVNLALAAIFFAAALFFAPQLFFFAAAINIWLAIFNLLPVPPLDGSKVFAWSRKAWLLIFAVSIAAFALLLA